MTHGHRETITFGTCLVICARTHTHTRAQTHAHTHFDIGTGTMGVPCLQAMSGGGGALLLSHIFSGGGWLENYLGGGGGWTRGSGRVFCSSLHRCFFVGV